MSAMLAASLEKQLVDTRLQLALAKQSEDQLLLKLNKINLASDTEATTKKVHPRRRRCASDSLSNSFLKAFNPASWTSDAEAATRVRKK